LKRKRTTYFHFLSPCGGRARRPTSISTDDYLVSQNRTFPSCSAVASTAVASEAVIATFHPLLLLLLQTSIFYLRQTPQTAHGKLSSFFLPPPLAMALALSLILYFVLSLSLPFSLSLSLSLSLFTLALFLTLSL
jgi:hypothetical protein